jgi:hypothetical protein
VGIISKIWVAGIKNLKILGMDMDVNMDVDVAKMTVMPTDGDLKLQMGNDPHPIQAQSLIYRYIS